MRISAHHAPAIKSVAVWLRLEIHNEGENPILLVEIEASEDLGNKSKVIGPPMSHVAFSPDGARAKGPIDFPMTFALQQGLHCWILCEVNVPRDLGEVLFELYADGNPVEGMRRLMRGMSDKLSSELSGKVGVLGI